MDQEAQSLPVNDKMGTDTAIHAIRYSLELLRQLLEKVAQLRLSSSKLQSVIRAPSSRSYGLAIISNYSRLIWWPNYPIYMKHFSTETAFISSDCNAPFPAPKSWFDVQAGPGKCLIEA